MSSGEEDEEGQLGGKASKKKHEVLKVRMDQAEGRGVEKSDLARSKKGGKLRELSLEEAKNKAELELLLMDDVALRCVGREKCGREGISLPSLGLSFV